MKEAEFDRHASHYRELHQQNIAWSGEPPEYFASYKVRDFAKVVRKLGGSIDGSYLDFGSGIGASIVPFHKSLPRARLICADVSAESLADSSRKHGAGPEYVVIREQRLPLADASLDGAFAFCVFHHIPHADHVAVLADLRRVLKPGAPLMIYEHNPINPLTVRAVNTCLLDENAVLIKAAEIRRRCERAGFKAVNVRYRVFFPALLKAMRPLEGWLGWLPLGAQYYVCGRA